MAKIPSVTINVHNIEFNHGDQIVINLIDREEPKTAPQPAHRFKVGDRVEIDGSSKVGEISGIDEKDSHSQYLVFCEGGICSGTGFNVMVAKPEHANHCLWFSENRLSPAPEPPKYTPQIGDRVVTNFGIGSVIRISGSGEVGVWHDTWDEGHNFHGIFDDLNGYRGWWVNYSNVKPLTGSSDV